MPTTFIIDKQSYLFKTNQLESNNVRIKQYEKGINKVYELNKKYNFDIYIADNGFDFEKKIKIPSIIHILKNNPNIYGKINKGSGIIEIWNNKMYKKYLINDSETYSELAQKYLDD